MRTFFHSHAERVRKRSYNFVRGGGGGGGRCVSMVRAEAALTSHRNHWAIDASNFNLQSYGSSFYDQRLTIGHHKYLPLSLSWWWYRKFSSCSYKYACLSASVLHRNQSKLKAIFTLQERNITTNKNSSHALTERERGNSRRKSKRTVKKKKRRAWKREKIRKMNNCFERVNAHALTHRMDYKFFNPFFSLLHATFNL